MPSDVYIYKNSSHFREKPLACCLVVLGKRFINLVIGKYISDLEKPNNF